MNLKNHAKDIIGNLRATFLTLLLSRLDRLHFPLDSLLEEAIATYRADLEEMLRLVCEIAQTDVIYEDMRSAIDDILHKTQRDYYDQEWLDILLALYLKDKDHPSFTFNDTSIFHKELKPIFMRVLSDLTTSILWGRVRYYDQHISSILAPPFPALSRLFAILHGIASANIALPNPLELFFSCVNQWQQSDSVQYALKSFPTEDNGLRHVIRELENNVTE